MTLTLDPPAPEILDDLTRRRFVAGGLGLGAIILTGCGEENRGDPRAAPPVGKFPVTIEHIHGRTRIPAEPKRVVTVGYTEQDYVLAFGVRPVGIRDWFGDQPSAVWPWGREALGAAKPRLVGVQEINLEAVAALSPDLIVGTYSGMTDKQYATYSKIAPTIATPAGFEDFELPWQAQTRTVGKALGRDDQAERLIADVEQKLKATREAHPQFAGASAIVVAPDTQNNYYPHGPADPRTALLQSLGFVLPPKISEVVGDKFSAPISIEKIGLLNADALVWISETGKDASAPDNPLYRKLQAHREGRDLFLRGPVGGALSFTTVLSIPFLLEALPPMLSAALDGDPSTRAA